jgi:hypothetical protein
MAGSVDVIAAFTRSYRILRRNPGESCQDRRRDNPQCFHYPAPIAAEPDFLE